MLQKQNLIKQKQKIKLEFKTKKDENEKNLEEIGKEEKKQLEELKS